MGLFPPENVLLAFSGSPPASAPLPLRYDSLPSAIEGRQYQPTVLETFNLEILGAYISERVRTRNMEKREIFTF